MAKWDNQSETTRRGGGGGVAGGGGGMGTETSLELNEARREQIGSSYTDDTVIV